MKLGFFFVFVRLRGGGAGGAAVFGRRPALGRAADGRVPLRPRGRRDPRPALRQRVLPGQPPRRPVADARTAHRPTGPHPLFFCFLFFFWLLSNDEAEFVTAATELVCKSFLSKLRRRQLVHADAFGHCCCEQKEIVSQFSSDCFPFRIQWPSDLTADLSLQQPAYSKGEPCGIR